MKARITPDRSHQNGQPPESAPASMFTPVPPQPPQVFPSEHAARSFEARMQAHYAIVSKDAEEQASHAAWLGRTILELRAENHQDAGAISHAEQVIAERRDAIQQRNLRIEQAEQEKAEKELQAANNLDDRDATAALLRLHLAKSPAPGDVLVAPVTDPGPTGALEAPQGCPCGAPMQWDRQRNQFIHPLPDGGWEVAGESCKRRRESTLTLPAVDDPVAGS